MMDILLPYKINTSPEIDWSIRSMRNVKHSSVYVITSQPLPGEYINPVVNGRVSSPFHDVLRKISHTLEQFPVSRKFILWNDDFFVLKKTKIPTVHRGYLKDVIAKRPKDSYRKALVDTYAFLITRGIKEPLCYELHIPMVFGTDEWRSISRYVDTDMKYGKKLLMRSIYGNLQNVGGEYMEDIKNNYLSDVFISTTEKSFRGEVGVYIKENLS